MKRIVALMLGTMVSLSAGAEGARAVRKTIEGSMQVTGEILISSEGELHSYTLDKPEALPEEVKRLVAKYLPGSEFEVKTASGEPGLVRARMTLQVVARQRDDGDIAVTVRDAVFEDPDTPELVAAKQMRPPSYPVEAVYAGVGGTVYVALRLNPDGSVAEVHAEQVDMKVVASDGELAKWRKRLAQAALARAKTWTFEIKPQRASQPGDIGVRVPVDFLMEGMTAQQYGKWNTYVPGPHVPIPWNLDLANDGVGAMVPGRLYLLDSDIKLREPPGQG